MYKTNLLTLILLLVCIGISSTGILFGSDNFPVVEKDAQAQIVFKQAEKLLKSKLGMTFRCPMNIILVTGKELDDIMKNSPYRGSIVGIHKMENGVHKIYMMKDVSRDKFLSVLCHEMTHGWQRENGLEQDIKLIEGLAVWVEYKSLMWTGAYALAQNINQNLADPVYGVGFRFVQELEDKHREQGVLKAIKNYKTIP
jgi:hypothetical protein